MINRDLLKNPPPKVLLMYQAVIDMVNSEEYDISAIKVSDITMKAGIGKGTAYEYFGNKEEIIVNALAYDTGIHLLQVEQLSLESVSFENKIRSILSYIDQNSNKNKTFCQLIKLGINGYDMPNSFREKYEDVRTRCECSRFIERILENILETGRREGIVKKNDPYLCQFILSSQIVTYGMYMMSLEIKPNENLSAQTGKDLICDSVVKILGE